jgi:hypothetical protein
MLAGAVERRTQASRRNISPVTAQAKSMVAGRLEEYLKGTGFSLKGTGFTGCGKTQIAPLS